MQGGSGGGGSRPESPAAPGARAGSGGPASPAPVLAGAARTEPGHPAAHPGPSSPPQPAPAVEGQGSAAPSPPAPVAPATNEECLRKELEEVRRRAEESLSSLQRVAADYENFKRFAERERSGAVERERARLLLSFIEVYENLERALEAGRGELGDGSALMRGLHMTLESARALLEREGVRDIEAIGAGFNPEFHEAVCFVPDTQHPEYTVVEEVRRGYTLNGRVLRPSKVTVATGARAGDARGGAAGAGGSEPGVGGAVGVEQIDKRKSEGEGNV